jgi:hypothetical protein
VEARCRRARAQVAALALALGASAFAQAAPLPEVGCAGDGDPPDRLIAPSGLLAVEVPLYHAANLRLASARVAICGQKRIKQITFLWNAGYEAYRADGTIPYWGQPIAAYLGVQPFRWLTIYAGIKKVAFSYAHDEPEQTLELRRPFWATQPFVPDRRLGLTLDLNFGTARVIAGAYANARSLDDLPQASLLIAGRALIEPLGPVGNRLSTVADDPFWRRRARFGLDLSFSYEWDWRNAVAGAYAVGGDVPFKWGPVGFVAEAIYWSRTVKWLTVDAQLAVMLWRPCLELEARWEMTWPITPTVSRAQSVTAGLTAYAWRSWVKIQLAYRHEFAPLSGESVLLGIQLAR